MRDERSGAYDPKMINRGEMFRLRNKVRADPADKDKMADKKTTERKPLPPPAPPPSPLAPLPQSNRTCVLKTVG